MKIKIKILDSNMNANTVEIRTFDEYKNNKSIKIKVHSINNVFI
jgi:hypothetical protein